MGLRLGFFYGGVGSSLVWVLRVEFSYGYFGELGIEV